MKNLKCLIADDEPAALSLIESYVNKTPFLELIGRCSDAFEVISKLNNGSVDLLFLDIQMPELTGIELAKNLPKDVKIIFTTAFEKYAIEGYKVNTVGYLLKPFDYNEFLNAANRARELYENEKVAVYADFQKDYIFVKSEYRQIKINLGDIEYIEGLKDYVKIYLTGEKKPILTLNSLKKLQNELPENKFMRVHRSYIVSLDKIDAIERGQILIRDERITIANQYKENFDRFVKS